MDYTLCDLLYTGTDTRVITGRHREHQAPVVLKLPRHELPAEETYMAPEQAGRLRRSIDARADLYALGGTHVPHAHW